jgi:hypothetical protein
MRDMVASCAAGYLDSTAILDMNYIEDSGGGPDVSVAYHPNLDKVVLLQVRRRRSAAGLAWPLLPLVWRGWGGGSAAAAGVLLRAAWLWLAGWLAGGGGGGEALLSWCWSSRRRGVCCPACRWA